MAEVDTTNIQIVSCLEDTIDKLQIAGQIMPLTYEMKANAKKLLEENINDIKETQREMEAQFSQLVVQQERTGSKLETTRKNLKAATYGVNRAFKQNPIGGDIFEKIEIDRLFLENLFAKIINEIQSSDLSFLKNIVVVEKNNKAEFQQILKREEESRQTIKDLQKSLVDIKIEKEKEIQQRNEMIAHLKDRLQELKAKTNMEAKYIKKSTDNSVSQTKKKCDLSEQELRQQIEKLQEQIDEENRCNAELESFLKQSISKHKQMTDHWSEKSDKETVQKQVDLDLLKTRRAKDFDRYQSLAKTFKDYEKVVVDYRNEKDKEKRKAEQEKFELEASVKIQAWWRSQMLRHKLGPHGKKKKKKKGKGKGKGKKK